MNIDAVINDVHTQAGASCRRPADLPWQGFFSNEGMAYQLYEIIAEHKLPAVFHSGHCGIGAGMPQDVIRFGFSADGPRSLDRGHRGQAVRVLRCCSMAGSRTVRSALNARSELRIGPWRLS